MGVIPQAWASQVRSNALGIARISKFFVLEAFAMDPAGMGQIETRHTLCTVHIVRTPSFVIRRMEGREARIGDCQNRDSFSCLYPVSLRAKFKFSALGPLYAHGNFEQCVDLSMNAFQLSYRLYAILFIEWNKYHDNGGYWPRKVSDDHCD
jgi:hypothetical protein